MTINYGVFAQAEVGFTPARSKFADVTGNDPVCIGCVPAGCHAQLVLSKSTTPGTVDVEVMVSTSMQASWTASLSDCGEIRSTTDPPLDLYNADFAYPVYVQKRVSGSDNFDARLAVIDAPWREGAKAIPRLVDTHTDYDAADDEVLITKPSGLLENDLLFAFIGVDDHDLADPTVERNHGGWEADTWTLMGSLDETIDPRIRVYFKLADAHDEDDVTEYRWTFAGGGPYIVQGAVHLLRKEDASSLGDYGLALYGPPYSLGFPNIWNGSGVGGKVAETTDTPNFVENQPLQRAILNVDTTHGESTGGMFSPALAMFCFAAAELPLPTVVFQSVATKSGLLDPSTRGECKSSNVMFGSGAVILAQSQVQLTGFAYFGDTPFDFQGAYVVLGMFT